MLETIFIWTGFITLELVMCAIILLCIISARTLIDSALSVIYPIFFVAMMERKLTYEERKFIDNLITKYK